MRPEIRIRRGIERWVLCAAVLMLFCPVAPAGESPDVQSDVDVTPYPFNEQLSYAISWAGIHCGHMQITSFRERDSNGEFTYRIVVLMRTSAFFDGIYRVRSRLDSFFDPKRMSSIRYEERSREKKKRKEDVWVVDLNSREVVRTKNGETTRIPIEVDRAFDPLAFIYRLRTVDVEVGDEKTLGLMTSKGAVETVVTAKKQKEIRTKMGRCDAVAMVPQPRDEMMFSKSGSMVVWIDQQPPHRPCKIEFDLSFGTLVASLRAAAAADQGDVFEDWENWSKNE